LSGQTVKVSVLLVKPSGSNETDFNNWQGNVKDMSSEQYSGYFKCGGCGRFVALEMMQKHYETNHKEGIAVESPPAPATVSNPTTPPMLSGHALPPTRPEPNLPFRVNIKLMYRNFPVAFMWWTIIVFAATSLLISTLYNLLVFHI
jgi:hypothetical protein